MYTAFYGLREPPFNITPDPRFLYFSGQHRRAYEHVVYGIKNRKGFIELTGEVGSGKTTICRAVLSELRGQSVKTALVLNPCLSDTQMLRAIVNDFGIKVSGRDRLSCIEQLNRALLKWNSEGFNVAVMIDEAQDLSRSLMEEVRLLSNMETDKTKLMQIVLCGQPELSKRLARPELRQLRQRIQVRCHIWPLEEPDTAGYIRHRLDIAGADGKILFDKEAVHLIQTHTAGIPRLINAVCDNALLAGYVAGSRIIGVRCVERAIEQLEGSG